MRARKNLSGGIPKHDTSWRSTPDNPLTWRRAHYSITETFSAGGWHYTLRAHDLVIGYYTSFKDAAHAAKG